MQNTLEKSVRIVCLDIHTRYGVIKNASVGFDYDLEGNNVSCDWSSMDPETAKQLNMACQDSMTDFYMRQHIR